MLFRRLFLKIVALEIRLSFALHIFVEICVKHLCDLTFVRHAIAVDLVAMHVLWSFLGSVSHCSVSVLLISDPDHIFLEE